MSIGKTKICQISSYLFPKLSSRSDLLRIRNSTDLGEPRDKADRTEWQCLVAKLG